MRERICVQCGKPYLGRGPAAKTCSDECGRARENQRLVSAEVPAIVAGRRTPFVHPRRHGLWALFLDKMVERRGVFYVRDAKTKDVVFIGRSQARCLSETVKGHIGHEDAECRREPFYGKCAVEVSVVWMPGLGQAESRYRKDVLRFRPRDVSGCELAEIQRLVNKRKPILPPPVEVQRKNDWDAQRPHKPDVGRVLAEAMTVPSGMPTRLDTLVGRLTDDMAETTPPGSIVLVEWLRHEDGDSVWRLGRLLENDGISDVFMFDSKRRERLPRRCLSVLLMGGAA